MITSTFLPAAAPPDPPPVLDDVPPAARPATTPRTTAMSTITATSDSENLILTFEVILSPPEKTFTELWREYTAPPRCQERTFSDTVPPDERDIVFPPPDDEGGRRRRGRQHRDRLARRERRPDGASGARGEGPERDGDARLPPQRRRELAAPRHVREHRPDLRRRREPVLRGDPRRRRGGGAGARCPDLRRQLRRGAGARARARRGIRRPR